MSALTVEVPGAVERPGEGKPRKIRQFANKPLTVTYDENVQTLYDNFNKGVEISGNRPCYGKRIIINGEPGPYVWLTYNEVAARRNNIASAFIKRGFAERENIGLFSVNRMEWTIAEHACFRANLCTVPLYDTLGTEAIEYICNQTELKMIFASNYKIKALLSLESKLKYLKTIVCMDDEFVVEGDTKIEIIKFSDFMNEGSLSPQEERKPGRDDPATICYTSGTTGLPKGVVLSHGNILSDVSSVRACGDEGLAPVFTSEDVVISYLPLAHVFERVISHLFIGIGARIGFYQGDTLKLVEDIGALSPTFFPSVPRLYNRIYDKVLAGVKSKGGLAEKLFSYGFNSKKEGLKKGKFKNWIWDNLLFAKVKERLGGKVRALITGSAPLSPEVLEFFRIAFGCDVHEGYGQTETSAGACLTVSGETTLGHVGVPLPCCEIKLVDVPEMEYFSTDKPHPRGEICVKGNNCFKEYFKQPEKTKETIDEEGWVHTGDIGLWNDRGCLAVIDRKKNIFKLAQGEYVAPEKVESVICKHPMISQAFVYGDSFQSCCVGIIVPDEDAVSAWAKQNSLNGSLQEICKNETLLKFLLKEILAFSKSNDLKGFEIPRAIHLEHSPFSIENDLLTPTFKLKRNEAKKIYLKEIENLYNQTKEK
ncbi:acetyl-CoA synthetase-like protein [Rozella allomycis CSF55]|uniref:Long-chain-fatty-acid--CoA ligase n=1 Tax=Rozella allomycis (strain CSF55) TaxID=988480 RepID=A0A4P9YK25_ROZAC|nr:acetyl-CoA synthetase-like protein [Rozella allomycis CSF55]